MLYFAYGTNMNPAQICERCPASKFRGIGRLVGRRLAFTRSSKTRECGVADVVKDPDSEVWGVLWEVDAHEVPDLDRHEGFRPGRDRNAYERRTVEIETEAGVVKAAIYLALSEARAPLPNRAYMREIIEGARACGLPAEYVAALEAIPTSD